MQLWFIRSFRARIHSDWLDASVLGGAVQIPDYYSRRASYIAAVRFKPRGWSWIDPTKEVQAYKLAVRCGFMTVSDVIAATANGADPEDIFKARAAELDLMESLGLVFDTNPAAVNDKGQSQPTSPTDGEPGEAEGAESPADDSATETKTETEKEAD